MLFLAVTSIISLRLWTGPSGRGISWPGFASITFSSISWRSSTTKPSATTASPRGTWRWNIYPPWRSWPNTMGQRSLRPRFCWFLLRTRWTNSIVETTRGTRWWWAATTASSGGSSPVWVPWEMGIKGFLGHHSCWKLVVVFRHCRAAFIGGFYRITGLSRLEGAQQVPAQPLLGLVWRPDQAQGFNPRLSTGQPPWAALWPGKWKALWKTFQN